MLYEQYIMEIIVHGSFYQLSHHHKETVIIVLKLVAGGIILNRHISPVHKVNILGIAVRQLSESTTVQWAGQKFDYAEVQPGQHLPS